MTIAAAVSGSISRLSCEMLAAERGAARNTLQAYRRDLDDFLAFLDRRGSALAAAEQADIGAYLRSLSEAGLAPASRARRLSAIRQLFKFLVGEGVVAEDPALGLCRPQAGPAAAQDALGRRGRPPDRGGAPPHRDTKGRDRVRALRLHALIETLYATGLRVTELVTLPRSVLAGRRPRPDRQGQGRARAHRAAHAGGARRARPLPQCRPGRETASRR